MGKSSGEGFDRIASIYDAVAGIASFNQINKSQLAFIANLSTQASCLIIGGGTGYFLQKLLEINTTIQVTYIEASAKMLALAQKRIERNIPDAAARVTFVCMRVENAPLNSYDVIVCNYFLDLFDEVHVNKLVSALKKQLNPQGLLYITDFHIPETNRFLKWGTQLGLAILYTLFRFGTKISATRLPQTEQILQDHGFSILVSEKYLRGILMCSLYKPTI